MHLLITLEVPYNSWRPLSHCLFFLHTRHIVSGPKSAGVAIICPLMLLQIMESCSIWYFQCSWFCQLLLTVRSMCRLLGASLCPQNILILSFALDNHSFLPSFFLALYVPCCPSLSWAIRLTHWLLASLQILSCCLILCSSYPASRFYMSPRDIKTLR